MKIGFVIPWYGESIPGGAESQCRSTAKHLQSKGYQVEILSTCIREFRSDWNDNYYPTGLDASGTVPVRRFRVKKKNRGEFHRINRKLMDGNLIQKAEEKIFIENAVHSDELVNFMFSHQKDYIYLLLPYMFGTTYFGALSCPDRCILIPCLHDEAYAYMEIYQEMFQRVLGIIFNTESERNLAEKIFKIPFNKGLVGGEGVDPPVSADGTRFRVKYGDLLSGALRSEPYILYAGRKDEGKNIGQLVRYFSAFKEYFGGNLKLILLGSGEVEIPPERDGKDIIDLGFVDVQDKWDAYAGALALCNPSLNESFSIVVMESWLSGTPVLVHEECDVTRSHCITSQGGLFYRNLEDFVGCLDFFLSEPNVRKKMALNGTKYVQSNYTWPNVISKYQQAFDKWGIGQNLTRISEEG